MMTIIQKPETYAAAYSPMPLRLESDEVNELAFKYLISVLYNKQTTVGFGTVPINGIPYLLVQTFSDHNLEVGDTVYLDVTATTFNGRWNVINVPSDDSVVLNVVVTLEPTTNGHIHKVFAYKMSPDNQFEAKLDLSNTIKDFVSQDLPDTTGIFESTNTFFPYELRVGSERRYQFRFYDNSATSLSSEGKLILYEPTLTSAALIDEPWRVGDLINIQQDTYEWEIESIDVTTDGYLKLINTTQGQPYRVGQTITISGLSGSFSTLNVTTTVKVVDSSNILTLNTLVYGLVLFSQTVTGVTTFGIPRPEYNVTARITNIQFESTGSMRGYMITTDVSYGLQGTPPIGGIITYADGRLDEFPNEATATSLIAYTGRLNPYTKTGFDKYIIKNRTSTLNYIATNYEPGLVYTVGKDSKFWLLTHQDAVRDSGALYKFYIGDTLTATCRLPFGSYKDCYMPAGFDQVLATPGLVTVSGSLTNSSQFTKYTVGVYSNHTTVSLLSNEYTFVLDDCTSYDSYNIVFKDRLGSWSTFPFAYFHKPSTEFERFGYQKNELNWTGSDLAIDNTAGDNTYSVKTRDKLILNSGWIKDHENNIIKDLFSSPFVLLQLPTGEQLRVIPTQEDFQFGVENQDGIYNYQISVNYSLKEYRV